MNSSFIISEKAIEDLENIWKYTFTKWSLNQADKYYNLLINKIEYLSKNSLKGKSIDNIRQGYKFAKVKSHNIFYKISNEDKIIIIRVLHIAMDMKKNLND